MDDLHTINIHKQCLEISTAFLSDIHRFIAGLNCPHGMLIRTKIRVLQLGGAEGDLSVKDVKKIENPQIHVNQWRC
jgi:hypothetical protein